MDMTPAEKAELDQQAAKIREYVLGLVEVFRTVRDETDLFTAQSGVVTGLFLCSQPKTVSIALMAITLLAEKED